VAGGAGVLELAPARKALDQRHELGGHVDAQVPEKEAARHSELARSLVTVTLREVRENQRAVGALA
jgi:hypothetical protein